MFKRSDRTRNSHFLNIWLCRGRVIKELGLRRTDLVVSTKLFWGIRHGPNDGGLSRKQYVHCAFVTVGDILTNRISIVEGTQESLARLGLDYVDIIFAHRPDHNGRHMSCIIITNLIVPKSSNGRNCSRL